MSFAKLDRDQIIQEAVALLKEEGLDAVSLRRIAARLGVSVSSLYWHINNKESLSALMSAAIFRPGHLGSADLDPRYPAPDRHQPGAE